MKRNNNKDDKDFTNTDFIAHMRKLNPNIKVAKEGMYVRTPISILCYEYINKYKN